MLGSISTISVSRKTRDDVYLQLTDLIGHQVKITSYYYKDLEAGGNFRDDLVLITSPWIKKEVLPLLAPDCPFLCAKRNLDLQSIHLLLDIPRGAEVLVVNDLYENAVEVVNELATFGVDQYTFVPYSPGHPLEKRFEYAVTIGEYDRILKEIPHVVDLGMRQINLLTVAEILKFFTNEIMLDELLTSRYTKTSVQSIFRLHNEVRQNEALRAQLSDIIEGIDDGVLIIGRQKERKVPRLVEFYNQAAAGLLQFPLGEGLPQWLEEALEGKESETFFLEREELSLNVELRPIGGGQSSMVILKDMALLRRIDVDYQTYQKDEGNAARLTFQDMLYADETMAEAVTAARQMADSRSNVLITGESGVGKEIMAQAIHNASPFANGPFVAINCGAIAEQLLESELFGYDEGAFTGALKKGKIGLIELANNGTLFLDEIGDAPLSIQQKLLRVIQEKKVTRVAGRQPINVNVRIIAATNQDLMALAAEKKFRLDLYYRLNVLSVRIPPLRQRKKDIPVLFQAFLSRQLAPAGLSAGRLTAAQAAELCRYDWPGNIRELQNLCEYLANYLLHTAKPDLLGKISAYLSASPGGFPAQSASAGEERAGDALTKEEAFILRLLWELSREGRLIGREQILALAKEKGRSLTDYRLKLVIRGLAAAGLVESARGRGTSLTGQGEELARTLAG